MRAGICAPHMPQWRVWNPMKKLIFTIVTLLVFLIGLANQWLFSG